MSVTITAVNAVLVHDGKGNREIFAPQSFADLHPTLTPHIFVCPDNEFYGPGFEQYAEKRMRNHFGEEASNG
jgi:hypothetical protein